MSIVCGSEADILSGERRRAVVAPFARLLRTVIATAIALVRRLLRAIVAIAGIARIHRTRVAGHCGNIEVGEELAHADEERYTSNEEAHTPVDVNHEEEQQSQPHGNCGHCR